METQTEAGEAPVPATTVTPATEAPATALETETPAADAPEDALQAETPAAEAPEDALETEAPAAQSPEPELTAAQIKKRAKKAGQKARKAAGVVVQPPKAKQPVKTAAGTERKQPSQTKEPTKSKQELKAEARKAERDAVASAVADQRRLDIQNLAAPLAVALTKVKQPDTTKLGQRIKSRIKRLETVEKSLSQHAETASVQLATFIQECSELLAEAGAPPVGAPVVPETPEQRADRQMAELKGNVDKVFKESAWTGGAWGGRFDVEVSSTDALIRERITDFYGQNVKEIPGHAGKTWPNKRKGTVVKYYVTATSKTPGIAYDISAHAFEPGIPAPKTVLVLHIPEKRIPEPRQEPKK